MVKKLLPGNLFRRILSLALAFVLLLGMVPVTQVRAADDTTLYLQPNSNWLIDDARFAVYFWNDSGDGWADMLPTEDDGIYEGYVPGGYSNIIFCRMDPGTEENNWDNKWNQTADLSVPTDGTDLYTVADGAWDNGDGTWSAYGVEPEEPTTVPTTAPETTAPETGDEDDALYIVAGDSALCGSNWDPADTANQMTKADDGTYQKVYTNVAAGTYNLKVTNGTWDQNWGDNGNNYTFVVSATCDVTVTFNPATGTVTVTGDNVGRETGLEITSMTAVGNGSGNWLNGANWDVASTANQMTEISDNIYEITFEDVAAGSYEFKFAANGAWTHSWGYGATDGEAVYNSQTNIKLEISYELADVTLRIDMTGYDHGTKLGAAYSVTVTEVASEPTVEYYLVGFINGADYGCNDDYANLGQYKFVDGKLTATFTADSYVFIKTGDNANWYMFESYVNTTSGTLYPSSETICEKMFVPGNVELEFTLVENEDGSLTLSYAEVVTEPTVDYYLIGFINGADYGCNDDSANLGQYKFVDGKLTAEFTQDSYVFIKTGDNANWYMTQAYVDASPATFHNTTTGAGEKLFVPGNVELEFTLVENEDGTLTLSYAEAADTNDVTIHFYKPDTWGGTVNAYLWTGSGAIAGYESYNVWPGKAVSANASHAGWYDLVVSTASPLAFNFIFNDGGNQTADLYTGEVTGDTELWVVGNDVTATAPGEWSGDYDYTAYLHFQKPAGWGETVNAWIWDANGAIPGYEDYNTTWPGKAVEADAVNSGWYNVSVTMDENAGFSFIFNDGSNQTSDLSTGTLEVKTHLWIVDGQILTAAPEGWKDPSRTFHVPGTFPGPSWDAASNTMSYDANLGLYVYTFENVPPANYEYKIAVSGSWNENYGAGGVRDGSNIAVAVPETMDVTIYYNDETHNSVCSVTYIFADVTLTGTGIPEGTVLTDNGLTGIYAATVPMTAGTYTDLTIICDGTEYPFAEITIEEDKDVTFYMDPVTEIYYCDASDIPVNEKAIYFDSQSETYKQPFGAVATGEEVTFAIDTGDDVTSAVLVVKGLGSFPMTAEETETGKRWSARASFASIGEYDYYFSLSNGSTVVIYSDDDGYYGEGQVTDLTGVQPYDLVVYKAGFETPDWMKDAVIYQIFPDRFFDGDVSNNQAQLWARGEVNYEYITDWYTLPENPEQEEMLNEATYKATGAHFGDGEWSNEIYGGDLDGIIQRVDYLKALGVNVIYLNPIFWSISNHRYDAVDYTEIDPILGTMGDFKQLVAVAEANDMHIILDGVFNHVSDDSVYFDRYYRFLGTSNKIGAYPYWAYVYDYMAENNADKAAAEAAAKAYFSENYGITDFSYTAWFAVSSTPMAGTVDNVGLRAGKEVYSYEGWWGYDSMPVIYSTNGSEYQTGNWAQEIIHNSGNTSVTQYWIAKGNNGWRLDVANEVSDETWQRFRDSVKALDSDAVIIGEIWDDATKYLKGDMYDSVMNYLFRNASTGFAMGTGAEATMKELEKIRERYPEEAFYAMMNLVGSHDTTRVLSYLDGIGDDRSDKSLAAAFPTYEGTSETAKERQYLVAFLQFTYAGAPTIYYGDEIGMVGSDDPDDRRAMEWGRGDQAIVEWYATLAAIREAYPALRTGSVIPMDLENNSLLGYIRQDENNTVTVIANNSASEQDAELAGTWVDLISGDTFEDIVTIPGRSGLILVAEEEVKTVTVNYAGLAPAYDPAYEVAQRPEGIHIHSYEAVVTEPTCTEEGYTTYTCSCGDSYVSKEVPALGHTEDAAVTEATCTEDGYTTYTCSVCGETRIGDEVPALGHSYSYTDADGIRTYTCDRCGDSYTKELVIQLAEGTSDVLFSGKFMNLKVIDLTTGKTLSGNKVQWTLAEGGEAYATINTSGRLTAQKLYSYAEVTVIGTLKGNENAEKIRHTVGIYPAATHMEVICGDEIVNGKTVAMDFTDDALTFRVDTYPLDTFEEVQWTISDGKKQAYAQYTIDGDTLTVSAPTGKAGTVNIKATVNTGITKNVSFKIQFAAYAKELTITNTEETLTSGSQLQLNAVVTPETVTKSGITWSLKNKADSSIVSLSGKGVLKAKTVYADQQVTVVATSKDGKASDEYTVTIVPKDAGMLVIRDEAGRNVTKSTVYVDLNTGSELALTAANYGDGAQQSVTWKSSSKGVATVEDGIVTFHKAGNVTITATAEDGRKATVTVKAAKLASAVEITSVNNFAVASGKAITLKATVTDAASKKVTWSIVSGSAYAKLSSGGRLTANKDLTQVQEVIVRATAADGSGKFDEKTVTIRPLAQGIHVYSIDEATGAMVLSVDSTESTGLLSLIRPNVTLTWNMADALKLSATVYPFYEGDDSRNADQTVTWKSSSTKVALVHEDGSIEFLKTGTVTITASTTDGSNKKVSFKLKVVAE